MNIMGDNVASGNVKTSGRITRPRVLRERPSGPGICLVAFLVLLATIGITRHAGMAMAQGASAVSLVSASSYQLPHVPANTLDGLHHTRWSAQGIGAWIQYDLRRLTMVQQAAIAWYRGNRRRAAFDIAVSTDAAHWAVVYRGVSSGKSRLLETYRFDPVQARYVRITGYGNSENQWNSLTEVVIHPRDPGSR